MKYVIIIINFILCPMLLLAQKQDSVVFKNAQKVILKNNLSAKENFKVAGQALIDKGLLIGSKDEEFFLLSSQPFKVSFGQEVINVVAKDNEIIITGKFKNNNALQLFSGVKHENAADPVVYANNDYKIERFSYLINLGKIIPHDKLYYSE